MFVFRKIWCALFSWNARFEIRPLALLPTISQNLSRNCHWFLSSNMFLNFRQLFANVTPIVLSQYICTYFEFCPLSCIIKTVIFWNVPFSTKIVSAIKKSYLKSPSVCLKFRKRSSQGRCSMKKAFLIKTL